MDLSFLEKNLWTSVPTAWGGAMEREKEGLEGGGRKRMGWDCRKWQCVCSDKPVARPSHPGGGLGATRLQPQCSVRQLSLMTLPRQLAAICVVDQYIQYTHAPQLLCIQVGYCLKKENKKGQMKGGGRGKIHLNQNSMHLKIQDSIPIQSKTTALLGCIDTQPAIYFYSLHSFFFIYEHYRGIPQLMCAHSLLICSLQSRLKVLFMNCNFSAYFQQIRVTFNI